METVTNVVNSASAAIWGKSSTPNTTTQNETAGNEPISGEKGAGTADEPFDKGNEDAATASATDTTAEEPNAAPTSATEKQTEATEAPDTTQEPTSTQGSSTTQSASDNDGKKLVERGELPHGSSIGMQGSSGVEKLEDGTEASALAGQEGGDGLGKETGPEDQSVKTSGTTGESGDFAGKEVARLQEEKSAGSSSDVTSSPSGSKDSPKPSKMNRLKEKLHIGSGKHI